MAQMRPVARNITVKPVVPMAYSSAKERAPEEREELVIKVYQVKIQYARGWTDGGVEWTFGVSRRTVSAWLKEQANDLPPLEETLQPVDSKKIPVLEWDELRGPLYFVAKTKFGSGLPWMERAEKSSPPPTAIAAKTPPEYSGVAYYLLIKKPSFSVIVGARIKPSSDQATSPWG